MNSNDAFRPKLWLRNGHAQTIWRKYAPVPSVNHRRQRVDLSDGDFIDLDWCEPTTLDGSNNGTIILLLHGLCGCSQSGYIQSLQYRLGRSGTPSVAMNFRGCSGEANRLARSYHSGVTADLAEVVSALRIQHPTSQFAAAGFSLGANVLLKWLGEVGHESPVHRAVAVSTPFNLMLCSQSLQQGLSRMYGRFFLRRLVADVENKKLVFQQAGNQEQLELLLACGSLDKLTSLWEFDDRVTAPLHGFADAGDYYEQCSSLGYLADIAVPTLLLQSRDDPIIPPHALPEAQHLGDPLVQDFSDRGGHVGFASASDRFWMEDRISNFLSG
jgi:predicted alpha/beta-fold hydrolase